MFRRAAIWAAVGAVIILLAGVALSLRDAPDTDGSPVASSATQPGSRLSPRPGLKPEEVVRIVVEALANNGADDDGIRITWAFASPGNKKVTGPIERFAPMVKSPAYRPMLNSASADYQPIVVVGDQAEQVVALTDADGDKAYYVFRLSRQGDGPMKDCWMTDGVFRVQPVKTPKPDEGESPQIKPKPEPAEDALPV
jgi:hypothetical protein